MIATANPTIVTECQAAIKLAEFSLVEFELAENNATIIAGRLRFPPLCARTAIREIIAQLVENQGTVLSQQCVGDAIATTGWSSLVFNAPLSTYQKLLKTARLSNLQVVRDSTKALLQKLSSTDETSTDSLDLATTIQATKAIVADESIDEVAVEVAEWLVLSKPSNEPEANHLSNSSGLTIATESQLEQLTLTKLKELAANHNIQGRSSMTKNLETAHKLLVPQLVRLVAIDEIS
ncbi:hypothetical protein IQ264_04470 [Phormidium sp. LEGE 05292]|uniref:hypothetical protein n=1 Tax=[Phormidium] sp. LEGE 05292 TaxID=767427 RepID=UPI001881000D|nr:hypothetical protein [Phormidium sp. LEGE 05292]MBE9224722.1 hypothetical protein [Phormidium sp. LEGE 05292]